MPKHQASNLPGGVIFDHRGNSSKPANEANRVKSASELQKEKELRKAKLDLLRRRPDICMRPRVEIKTQRRNLRSKQKRANVRPISHQPQVSKSLKLQFQQRCPEKEDVLALHPKIKNVLFPRKASSRWCVLKFSSPKDREEVRSALNDQIVAPFPKRLRCYDIVSKVSLDKSSLMRRQEVKFLKMAQSDKLEMTTDMRINSTARELMVRYGAVLKT